METDLNKVLLIDEDTDSAKNARMILELSGLLVDVEHDGKKGLSKALSEKYDMIILENVDFVHHTPMTVLPMI